MGRNKSFSDFTHFQFKGTPRAVRVWDETFVPSYDICLSRDTLLTRIETIRNLYPEQTYMLEEWLTEIGSKADGELVKIEAMHVFGFGLDIEEVLRLGRGLDDETKEILTALRLAGGRKAIIRKPADNQPHFIITHTDILPVDLAPMVILDASARVRYTYKLWSKHRGNLEFLKPASKDYSSLSIHLWSKGAGRTTIALKSQNLFSGCCSSYL